MNRTEPVKLRDEPQPDPEALAQIEAIEESGNVSRVVWVEESEEEYLERLADYMADPDRDSLESPERGDMVERTIEDRSACDLAGLTTDDRYEPLSPYIALLQELLPGYVHGFSPSLEPDRKTPRRSRIDAKGESVLTDEFVRCLQCRVRLGQSLQRPEDRPRQLPGRHDT
jgi:hypothetical protein